MVMAKCVKKCLMEKALVGSSVTKPTMADSSKEAKGGVSMGSLAWLASPEKKEAMAVFLVSRSSLSFLIQGSHADSSGWGRSTEEPAAAATSTPASASLSLQPAPPTAI